MGALPQRALELLETMPHQGLLPNVITYSALISACEKGYNVRVLISICEKGHTSHRPEQHL